MRDENIGENENIAREIFVAAIREGRCEELLDALFGGGSATVDAVTRKLVILPLGAVLSLLEDSQGDAS